jgi:hypothetical protein
MKTMQLGGTTPDGRVTRLYSAEPILSTYVDWSILTQVVIMRLFLRYMYE